MVRSRTPECLAAANWRFTRGRGWRNRHVEFTWWSQRDSNPCYRRESAFHLFFHWFTLVHIQWLTAWCQMLSGEGIILLDWVCACTDRREISLIKKRSSCATLRITCVLLSACRPRPDARSPMLGLGEGASAQNRFHLFHFFFEFTIKFWGCLEAINELIDSLFIFYHHSGYITNHTSLHSSGRPLRHKSESRFLCNTSCIRDNTQ